MKNLRTTITIFFMTFLFTLTVSQVHAVSTTNSNTTILKEKKGFAHQAIKKIKRTQSKFNKRIQSLFTPKEGKSSLFWLWAALLTIVGIVLGVSLIILGLLLLIISASSAATILGLILLFLGIFLPILSLFFTYRPLLRKHYSFLGREFTKRKINIQSLLLSLIPGIIASVYFVLLSLLG